MRPVNLIPPEEQGVGSGRGPLRTGPAAYIIVGALALALVMVIAMAITNKQIDDQTAKKTTLDAELTAATARAQSLRAFSDFRDVQEKRTQTVSSLAQSRFDWERVLRELSLILPSDVWLLKMTGTVNPAVSLEGGAEVALRDSIEGPALEIVGLRSRPGRRRRLRRGARGHRRRHPRRRRLLLAERPDLRDRSRHRVGEAASEAAEDCRYDADFDYQFEIAVAFDSVPTPPAATAPPSVPSPTVPTTSPSGQLAEAGVAADTSAQTSAAQQTAQAQEAADALP